MKLRVILAPILAVAVLSGGLVAPVQVNAASKSSAVQHRQKTKNQWRNIAYGAGAIGLWGLLKNDKTLIFAGAAGALYSYSRYEHDRKSQNKLERARASVFSKTSFTRDGQRYVRRTMIKNGKKHYQFVKAR